MRSRSHLRSHPDRSTSPARRRLVVGALSGVAAVTLAVGGLVPAQAAPPSVPPGQANGTKVDINLVTVNDFHGRIEQAGTAGGIARLATAVKQIRAENPNTVFAAAGDMIGASTFTSFIQQDVPTIETLNEAGLEVSAVGNHEFDRGFARPHRPGHAARRLGVPRRERVRPRDRRPRAPRVLDRRVPGQPGGEGRTGGGDRRSREGGGGGDRGCREGPRGREQDPSRFPQIKAQLEAKLAGVREKIESKLAAAKEKIKDKYAKNLVRVGFVGAVTDELPSLVSPAGIEDISVGSPVEAANRVADQLSDGRSGNGEADIVVMLVHEGAATTSIESATDPTTRFGDIVLNANDNIDAIVSGHTHLAYNHVIDGRPVISSGQYGERFSNMEISYDRKAKKILSMENTIYTMATAFDAQRQRDRVPDRARPHDRADRRGGDARSPPSSAASVLGTAAADFGRAVRADPVARIVPREPRRRVDTRQLRRRRAEVVVNADQSRGVQITFMNPGGLRADLASGDVTVRARPPACSRSRTRWSR